MDKFYEILTGEKDAFFRMCMALPDVINSVINEDSEGAEGSVSIPRDTVIQELKNVAALYDESSENLSMAMAVYMLGFSTYTGFSDKIREKISNSESNERGECGDGNADNTDNADKMIKRIYEYARLLR